MNTSITFKNFEPSDHLRKYANRRFEKLSRFVRKSADIEVQVVLSVDKYRHCAEVKVTGDSLSISAMEQSEEMYASIDMVSEKVIAQIKKQMEIRQEKRKAGHGDPIGNIDVFRFQTERDGDHKFVTGEEKFEPKPLFPEEAALQLEQRDDEFLVFVNAETETVNVIYRRKNGQFGLIDIDNG